MAGACSPALRRADARPPPSNGAAFVIAMIWLALVAAAVWYVAQRLQADAPPPTKAKPSKPATRSNSGPKGER